VTDGSSQLFRTLLAHELVEELHLLFYPLTLGRGKRIWADEAHTEFTLKSATPYPTGVVGLHWVRQR
jgi:dihydrofolate reductase